MGLKEGKCDSCEEECDILFPVGILDELPSGGTAMVQRWYCVSCKADLEAEADAVNVDGDSSDNDSDSNNDDDNGEVPPPPPDTDIAYQ